MSDFDRTTEQKAEDYAGPKANRELRARRMGGFTAGRNSAKESLEVLARALEYYNQKPWDFGLVARQAIAAVKARGDWPLDKPAESQGGKGERT